MEIDWAKLHKDSTTVIEGEFPVTIVEANATKTSTDKPMIKCKLKVESGVHAGHVLFHNFTVSAESTAAMRMFFSHMSVLGLDANFFATNPTMEQVAQALVQRRATAEVGSRVWQGAAREEVKSWKPILGPGGNAGPAAILGGGPGAPSGLGGTPQVATPKAAPVVTPPETAAPVLPF